MELLLGYHPIFFAIGFLMLLVSGLAIHREKVFPPPYENIVGALALIFLLLGIFLWHRVDDVRIHQTRLTALLRFESCILEGKTPVMVDNKTECLILGARR